MSINLNECQTKTNIALQKFLQNENKHNFLLLGPAGSGKTTVITNVFNGTQYKIAFCAFTNKATQVLKNISNKFNIVFQADFMTIHKLLVLEIKYLGNEKEIAFTFNKKKIANMKEYDIIIFDECSTISKELYQYICEAWEYIYFAYDKKLKYIFIGDYWQLPPVGEENSIVFQNAPFNKWPIAKLSKVMRYNTENLEKINMNLLEWITSFKAKDIDKVSDFVYNYPYNIVSEDSGCYLSNQEMLDKYFNTLKNITCDTVILTYSKANCNKINESIQDRMDLSENREVPDKRQKLYFYKGDRCCIDRPIEVHNVVENKNHEKYGDKRTLMLDKTTTCMLYNGEIFDIDNVEDVNVTTALNRFHYIPKYFEAQLLKVKKINDDKFYEIIHIDEDIINNARKEIYKNERRLFYLQIMSDFIKKYPKLEYGYCITIYKSQGSEWNTVFVNLNSIKWSIIGQTNNASLSKKICLLKSTYTAISRATDHIMLFWSY